MPKVIKMTGAQEDKLKHILIRKGYWRVNSGIDYLGLKNFSKIREILTRIITQW